MWPWIKAFWLDKDVSFRAFFFCVGVAAVALADPRVSEALPEVYRNLAYVLAAVAGAASRGKPASEDGD